MESEFKSKLKRPAQPGNDKSWGFVVMPKAVSDKLPRRGRTTVDGTINGSGFTEILEPDGQKSHWLRVSQELQTAANVTLGDEVTITIKPVSNEPEPEVPADLQDALTQNVEAQRIWQDITTIARLDWIHWITSAKQTKTRTKRINDACEMLASGKKRVCCFDPSGFYSKAIKAPEAAD